jgi:hypothetical protein
MFSIELVQASERLSFTGKPRRLTVSISFEHAGGDTGRLLVKPTGEIAQQPFGFMASSRSQTCRSARRTDACNGWGSRSITLRAL